MKLSVDGKNACSIGDIEEENVYGFWKASVLKQWQVGLHEEKSLVTECMAEMEKVALTMPFPANTKRNKHVIITSKRHFDVIITCLLRCVCAGSFLFLLLAWHLSKMLWCWLEQAQVGEYRNFGSWWSNGDRLWNISRRKSMETGRIGPLVPAICCSQETFGRRTCCSIPLTYQWHHWVCDRLYEWQRWRICLWTRFTGLSQQATQLSLFKI